MSRHCMPLMFKHLELCMEEKQNFTVPIKLLIHLCPEELVALPTSWLSPTPPFDTISFPSTRIDPLYLPFYKSVCSSIGNDALEDLLRVDEVLEHDTIYRACCPYIDFKVQTPDGTQPAWRSLAELIQNAALIQRNQLGS
jgi:hypothetical protein